MSDQAPAPAVSEGNVTFKSQRLTAHLQTMNNGNSKYSEIHLDPVRKKAIQEAFLMILMKGGTVTGAINKLNGTNKYDGDHMVVNRITMYAWRQDDPEFRDAWDEAYDAGTDELEEIAEKFAVEGNASLIQFLLRVRNARRYNTAQRIEGNVNSNVAVTFTFKLDNPKDDRLDLSDGSESNEDSEVKQIEGDFERIQAAHAQ